MKFLRPFVLIATLAGCSIEPMLSSPEPPLPILTRVLDLPYPKARKLVLDDGWRPRRFQITESPSAGCFHELGFSEVQQCSGTGLDNCLFFFARSSGECLQLITSGARESAKVSFAQLQCPD
jgi:hypothetical protein